MDKEPFIIKSGKGHSVEIEQGSTHARRKNHLVAPQDEAPDNRVLGEFHQQERKAIDLGQHSEEQLPAASESTQQMAFADSIVLGAADDEATVDLTELRAAETEVQLDPASSRLPQDGPVIVLEAQTEEGAKAAKEGIQTDRFLSGDESSGDERQGRGPKESVTADRFAGEPSAAVQGEDMRGPAEPEPPQTNRQKVDSLQARANRIQIEQSQQLPSDLQVQVHTHEPFRLDEEGSSFVPAERSGAVEEEAVQPVLPQATDDLPPELAGNLGYTPAASAEPSTSAWLARVKALRNNMSVTDDRLSKLQNKPPIKP